MTPNPLLVIRFSSGHAGVVLDVSDGGLGFLASAPLEETRAVCFEISGRSMPRCEATGRLMWKDSTGKRAGLQLTEVPEELRALIRGFLPAALPRAIQKERITTDLNSPASNEIVRPASRHNPKRMIFAANVVTAALACLIALGIWQSLGRGATSGSSLHWKQVIARWSSMLRVPRGSSGLAKPAQNVPHASAELPKLTAPSSSSDFSFPNTSAERNQPAPPATAANLASSTKLDAPKSAQPKTAVPAKPAVPISEKRAALRAPEVVNEAPLAPARELLQTDVDAEKQAAAVQLLWQAVAKGDVAAEVALAGRYLSGQGVTKNCGQARVLLTAAQSRKSEEAGEKLGELSKYGCE